LELGTSASVVKLSCGAVFANAGSDEAAIATDLSTVNVPVAGAETFPAMSRAVTERVYVPSGRPLRSKLVAADQRPPPAATAVITPDALDVPWSRTVKVMSCIVPPSPARAVAASAVAALEGIVREGTSGPHDSETVRSFVAVSAQTCVLESTLAQPVQSGTRPDGPPVAVRLYVLQPLCGRVGVQGLVQATIWWTVSTHVPPLPAGQLIGVPVIVPWEGRVTVRVLKKSPNVTDARTWDGYADNATRATSRMPDTQTTFARLENPRRAMVATSRRYARAANVSMGTSGEPARSPSWQDRGMERVLGIGGYFMRAADPAALGAWYRDCLGLDADENGLWRQEAGPTVFATFDSETDYFGSRAQQTMLNFRVRDLDAMLAQLRAKGADVAEETQDMEGVGRFGWVTDPEGNRVELWQPA